MTKSLLSVIGEQALFHLLTRTGILEVEVSIVAALAQRPDEFTPELLLSNMASHGRCSRLSV
jgi:hypothetical protein